MHLQSVTEPEVAEAISMKTVENLNQLHELSRMIGNTPLLGIDYRFRGQQRTVYAKCEYVNLTGSIKDRMALHILRVTKAVVLASITNLRRFSANNDGEFAAADAAI
jgi:cysteine synthase A